MANFSIDHNNSTDHHHQIPCTMLNTGGATLVQLDNNNRPMSTSTPNTHHYHQIMPIKSSSSLNHNITQQHTKSVSRLNTHQQQQQHTTPSIKNPNRNKKVKDLIHDLRIQQQEQQQQQLHVINPQNHQNFWYALSISFTGN